MKKQRINNNSAVFYAKTALLTFQGLAAATAAVVVVVAVAVTAAAYKDKNQDNPETTVIITEAHTLHLLS